MFLLAKISDDDRLLNVKALIAYIFLVVNIPTSYKNNNEEVRKVQKFILYDDEREAYIMKQNDGRYTATTNEALAERFASKAKADSVLRNSISSNFRKRYKPIPIDENEPNTNGRPFTYIPVANRFKEVSEKIKESSMQGAENNDIYNIVESLKNNVTDMKAAFTLISQKLEQLSSEHSIVEKEINDVEHLIEFYSFNACQGYAMCKMLQELRKRRRSIKQQMETVSRLRSLFSDKVLHRIEPEEINKCLTLTNDKYYTPRVLTELFEKKFA